jgi:hypothetical protein
MQEETARGANAAKTKTIIAGEYKLKIEGLISADLSNPITDAKLVSVVTAAIEAAWNCSPVVTVIG